MPQSSLKNRAHEKGLKPPAGEQSSGQGCNEETRNGGTAPSRVSDVTWSAWNFLGFDAESPRQSELVTLAQNSLLPLLVP